MGLLFVIHLHDTITASISLWLFAEKKIQILIKHPFKLDKDEIFFFYSQGDEIIIWVTKISGGLSILSEQFEV